MLTLLLGVCLLVGLVCFVYDKSFAGPEEGFQTDLDYEVNLDSEE